LGALPVLREGDTVLHDAAAILLYVAAGHAPAWYPPQPRAMGEIQQWLGFAAALTASAGAARLHEGFNIHTDSAAARDQAHRLLRRLDAHLWFAEQQGRRWLCAASAPSIADIACFPDIMLAEEGGVMLHEYPAIRRWCDRVKRLPGFIAMPGVFPAGAAAYTL
jgi:glutathione S-transferase